MTQFQNDIASLTQESQSTQGHHHHHHHKVNATGTNSSTSGDTNTGSIIASLQASSAYDSGVQAKSNISTLNVMA